MSRKSTPSRPTPPCTPKSSNHRHSIGATPNKKSLPVFNSYMSLFQVQEKLKKGEVIEGVLRINPKSYEDAYISAPVILGTRSVEGGMDIFIGGVPDRNAALHGDIVAALIYPPEQWKVFYPQLDAYLEENLELKALVYKPLEPVISNFDNASTSTLSSTIKHTTNIETLITNDDSPDVVVEESCVEEEPQHQLKEHSKKKKKRHRRGKKTPKDSAIPQAQSTNDHLLYVEDSIEIISSPSIEEVSAATKQQTQGIIIVPPDELNECDFSDDRESISSLTLDVEEKLFLRERAPPIPITNEKALGLHIEPSDSSPNFNPNPTWAGSRKAKGPLDHKKHSQAQKKKNQNKPKNIKTDKRVEQQNKRTGPVQTSASVACTPFVSNDAAAAPSESNECAGRSVPNVFQIQRLTNWDRFVQKTARVVHILERKHPMIGAGILKLFADKNPNMALFSPFDCRLPRVKIQMHKCPPDFFHRSEDYSNKIFLAKITEWNNPRFAFGDLIKNIGQVGDIEAEIEALLLENNVDTSDFPQTVYKEFPELPWKIPQEEIERRTDLRGSTIFTIDPASARDLDDAVSCLPLPSGNFRVGVHIADVSYFVKADTLMDKIAADRANSFYLVHKVIPMLPSVLCENLCSLNPKEDRLAFSAIWELTPAGQVVGEWFGRTVIRSCAKFSYDHVQEMIDHPEQDFEDHNFPPVEGRSVKEIAGIVNNLHRIAVQLRQKRVKDGALRLNQVKLGFTLEADSLSPNGVYVQEVKESNKLVEEFMLLANIAVAQKIHDTFPNISVLRMHPPPHDVQLENVVNFFSTYGINLDSSSSKTLNDSIQKYVGSDALSIARMKLIVNLCSKPMQYAKYVCTGGKHKAKSFHHYALNVPRYTHFTSPIRRYADIMVHRLLAAAIDPGRYPLPDWNQIKVAFKAQQCNDKKQAAKVIHETNSDLFLALFIRNVGEMVEQGMIIGVLDRSVDVMICRLGIIKRCYMEKLPVKFTPFIDENQQQKSLIIEWEENKQLNLPSFTQKLSYFDCVTVILRPFENDALKFNAFLTRSDAPLF